MAALSAASSLALRFAATARLRSWRITRRRQVRVPRVAPELLHSKKRGKTKKSAQRICHPLPRPSDKISAINTLAAQAGVAGITQAYENLYNAPLRNAITHADYVMRDHDLLSRGGSFRVGGIFTPLMPYAHVGEIIARTFSFYSAFFGLEEATRAKLGQLAGRALPYDPSYKGILELLADEQGALSGFVLHWPNGTDTMYERRPYGCVAQNMAWNADGGIEPFVGLVARNPGSFSPLVEVGAAPAYSPSKTSGDVLSWPS